MIRKHPTDDALHLGTRHLAADGERFGAFDPSLAAIADAATFVPHCTDDPEVAACLVADQGSGVLIGVAEGDAALRSAISEVAGQRLDRISMTRLHEEHDGSHLVQLRHDASSLWPDHPDLVFILTELEGTHGGASMIADGWTLMDRLATCPGRERDATLLAERDIVFRDAKRPGDIVVVGRVDHTIGSRRMVNRNPYVRPLDSDPDPVATGEALWIWDDLVWTAWVRAPRFTLHPGELLCLDNHRVLHGRTPFSGHRRIRVGLAYTEHARGHSP